jgi:PTH2 family peptidyl-tRNA hydrolase
MSESIESTEAPRPKQVIVMRTDLKMRKGKIAAQAAHAAMKVFFDMMDRARSGVAVEGGILMSLIVTQDMWDWAEGIFTKICAAVDSEQELLDLYEKAKAAGLPCSLIEDRGLTEFGGQLTKTCISIGPAAPKLIDPITGHLRLL